MIFLLTNIVNGQVTYLSGPKEYIVGRKNCDILLENDQSISRKHAVFRVKDDHVTLMDCESKYHTFLNGTKIDQNVEKTLKHMDSIQFGIFNFKFSFEMYRFMVAASALSSDKKAALRQNLTKCGAKYVDKWSDKCTHLTVEKLTLTIKVLHALVDEKPIVTLDYWSDYADSLEKNKPAPDINKYNRPQIAEQLLRSDFEYKIDPQRKTLFENKLFIFLKGSTKKQMEDVIRSCGGSCIAWEEEPKTVFDINRSSIEHLIVKTDDNDEPNVPFNALLKELTKQKKRPIPINEIALAIIHCTCDVNCNPNFNKVTEVFGATSTQDNHTRGVLAMETQSENFMPGTSEIKTEKVIPPSLEDDWMLSAEVQQITTAQTSGIKRPNKENAENMTSKKLKSEAEAKEQAKQTKIDAFVEHHTTKTNPPEQFRSKNQPQPSQKRKAVEDVEAGTSLKLNPFNLIKVSTNKKSKPSEEVNPFELTRTSKQTKTVHTNKNTDNPFTNILSYGSSRKTYTLEEKAEIENIVPKKEPKREIKLIPLKSDISNTSSTKKSFLNVSWLSKNSIKNTVKNEVKEEDPDLAKIAEAFKDCLKVQVLPSYERSDANISDTSVVCANGKKNFKKFKKVRPLKPQITIISSHQLRKIAPGDATGIEVNDNGSEDEGGFSNSKTKQSSKTIGKRFVL